jgi:hypothetical protein
MIQIDQALQNSRVTLVAPVKTGLRKDISGEPKKDIIFYVESGDFRSIDNIGGFYTFSVSNNVENSIKQKLIDMKLEQASGLSISVKTKELEMVESLDEFLNKSVNRYGNDYGVSLGILWIQRLAVILFDLFPEKYPLP